MSQYPNNDTGTNSQPLWTTSARLVAVKLKSANKNIFRALMSLGSANLVQRMMGLVNTIIVTAIFGQGPAMDAYYVAIILPLTLSDLLAGAMEASVIPVYAKIRTRGSRDKASRLFSTMLNVLLIAAILLTGIMLLFRQQLVILSAPGLTDGQHGDELNTAISLSLIVFPVLSIKILNSFLEALLNAEGQFGWPAYAGMLNPLVTAIFVLVGGRHYGVAMLCIGLIAGALAELSIILVRAHKAKLKYSPIMDFKMPEIQITAKAALPALSAGVISMAGPYVDQIFTSFLPITGSIAALNNALKLNSVPSGVILAAVGRAALPYLAAQAAIKDMRAFKETLRLYLWAVTLATLVVAIFMAVLANPIITIMLKRGEYNAPDAELASTALVGLMIGLPPMAVGWIVSRAFSALAKTRMLVYISIFTVIANAIFDAVLGHFLGILGITLATSAVYFCTMIILLVSLRATIGKLNLLTPPKELLSVVWNLGIGQFYVRWLEWKDDYLAAPGLSYEFRKQLSRVLLILLTFAGAVGLVLFVEMTHQTILLIPAIAFGSLIILAWLRNPYFLLLCWAAINPFIGSNLPFFNGAHFLSGFTIPTLLLLFWLPTKQVFKRMPMLPFLLIYLLWMVLGITISPMTPAAFLITWTTFLDYVGVAVLVVIVVNTRKRLLTLIDVMMIPATFIAFYGLYGYLHKINGVIDPTTGYFRISSIFGNTPPTLAMFMSIMLPLFAYRLLTLRGFKLVFGFGLMLSLLAAWGLTFDRSSQVTIAFSAIIILPFLPSKTIRNAMIAAYGAVGGLVILAAVAFNLPIFSRFLNGDIGTLNGRTLLWQALLQHFDPTQLMGYGHGASDILLQNLKVGFAGGVIATAAHNIYLESMFETGFIGVTLMVTALAVLGVSLLVRARKASPDRRLLIALALSAFVSVAVQSYASNDIWIQMVGIPFMIFMALPFALCWKKEEETLEQSQSSVVEAEEVQEGIEQKEQEFVPA